MKNLLKIALALLLVTSVMAFMFACDKKGANNDESSQSVSESQADTESKENQTQNNGPLSYDEEKSNDNNWTAYG